jgi:hypothetical protein
VRSDKPAKPLALASHLVFATFLFMALVSLGLGFRTREQIADSFIIDDGYYAYTIAYNIAAGKGVTIDGTTQTNGFQPFMVFASVLLFRLASGDRFLALRVMFFFHWAILVLTALGIGTIAARFRGGAPPERRLTKFFTGCLYLASQRLLFHHLNGLETGLLTLEYALLCMMYPWASREAGGRPLLLGAALGLLVLTRVDSVFLVIVIAWVFSMTLRPATFLKRAAAFASVGGTAFLVSAPWWLYGLLRFGSLMPVSGRCQHDWIFASTCPWMTPKSRLVWAAEQMFRSCIPISRLHPTLIVLGGVILGVVLARARRGETGRSVFLSGESRPGGERFRMIEYAAAFAASQALLALWYLSSSTAVYFFDRYLVGTTCLAIVVAALLLVGTSGRSPLLLWLLLCVLCVPAVLTERDAMTGRFHQPQACYGDQLGLVRAYVPEEATLGAGQSGTVGYFREGVVNLDGRVNPLALGCRGRMNTVLDRAGIRWICDVPDYLTRLLGRRPEECGFVEVARRGAFVLYRKSDRRGMREVE